jgi:hypothetical protein
LNHSLQGRNQKTFTAEARRHGETQKQESTVKTKTSILGMQRKFGGRRKAEDYRAIHHSLQGRNQKTFTTEAWRHEETQKQESTVKAKTSILGMQKIRRKVKSRRLPSNSPQRGRAATKNGTFTAEAWRHGETQKQESTVNYFPLSIFSGFRFSAIFRKASTISSGWSRWIQCALLAATRCLPCKERAAMALCSAMRTGG